MEEHIHKTLCHEEYTDIATKHDNIMNDNDSTTSNGSNSSASSKGCTTSDRYLVLQVMYWMMEFFSLIMYTLFLLARQK